jgi:phosphatidylserine/phosphatidylglycerophosphate/cardiolipin synthase-like enzyme
LHAKLLVADKWVIVGSANASDNSANLLDEAAVETSDPYLRNQATRLIESFCTEPIRGQYLRECIAAYRPPKFKAAGEAKGSKRRPRPTVRPKLWIIGGLEYREVPKHEAKAAEAAKSRAQGLLRGDGTHVEQTHYGWHPAFITKLQPGDWAITCIRNGRGLDI